jgi:hypothetical protein
VTADPTYNQVAGVGFNINQGIGGDGTAGIDGGTASIDGGTSIDGGLASFDGGGSGSVGTITIGTSLTVSVEKSGTLPGNSALRVQVMDANNNFYCYSGKLNSGVAIPVGAFNTKCWDNSGKFATPSTRFKRVDVLVPGAASSDEAFAFCLTNVSVE